MTETEPQFRWRSVSQLTRFASCSMAFKLQKLDKAPEAPAAWIAEGNAFHSTVDYWEQTGRMRTPASLSEFAEAEYLAEIGKLKEQEPDLNQWLKSGMRKPETDIEKRLETVRSAVAHYATVALTEPWRPYELPDGSPASEVPFEVKLTDTMGIRGQIDLLMEWPDGSLRCRDYKTGSKLPGLLQLGVYRLALKETLDLDVSYGDYWMSKKGSINGPHDLTVYTRDRLVGYFEALDRGVAEGVFLPNVGDHCTPCAVKKYCPEQGNMPVPQRVAAVGVASAHAVPSKEG